MSILQDKLKVEYHITLENSQGCELDGRFAPSEADINNALRSLIKDSVFADGDVIRIRAVKDIVR